ncbi:hypothetical protein BJV78DRAFT_1194562 [Lactifluus subvellereus]|nr:hypothetical protein BJV78DRAFT_1194562 [Lactifluus subvellereus]
MRVTRTTSRALQKQQQGGHRDGDTKRSPGITIDKLPGEILLEIFDSYRQCLELEQMSNHERAWNGRNGWFILAHVCQNWRCVVLASPSRLHIRLFFAVHTPTRAAVLRNLPPLPIVIDYSTDAWTSSMQIRMVSLLEHSERVHRIAYRGSGVGLKKVLAAMNHTFSALESLEIHRTDTLTLDFPAALRCSIHRLRRLKFLGAPSSFLSQLLSSTTSLTHLCLTTHSFFFSSLPIHLTTMPFLRFLALEMYSPRNLGTTIPAPPVKTEDIFPLPELTHFHFDGQKADLEVLVAGLAAPSLKSLQVMCYDHTGTAFSISHLSRFIRDVKRRVSAVNINIGCGHFTISMLHSIDDSPFKIEIIPQGVATLILQIVTALSTLSATLATVEELLLTAASNTEAPSFPWWILTGPILWRGLLENFCNVKILRIRGTVLLDVVKFLEQDDGKSALDLLPALEQIELYAAVRHEVLGESQPASRFEWFEPFAAARQRAGRPVKVSWNADLLPPNYFLYKVPCRPQPEYAVGIPPCIRCCANIPSCIFARLSRRVALWVPVDARGRLPEGGSNVTLVDDPCEGSVSCPNWKRQCTHATPAPSILYDRAGGGTSTLTLGINLASR